MSSSVFQILFLPVSLTEQASGAAPGLARSPPLVKGNCTRTCGGIAIPFPFGIGIGCFLSEWFEIVCKESNNVAIPILNKANLTVLKISLPNYHDGTNGMISVSLPIIYSPNGTCRGHGSFAPVSLKGSQFIFSESRNVFAAVGCNICALLDNTMSAVIGCQNKCEKQHDIIRKMNCSGSDGCCHTTITSDLQAFSVTFRPDNKTAENKCEYAFLGERSQFTPSTIDFDELEASGHFPAVLEWGIANSSQAAQEIYKGGFISDDSYFCSRCSCHTGFTGNPYIKHGCEANAPKTSVAAPSLAKLNCTETCGNVTIPFPFGMGAGCFLDDWYQIICLQNNMVPILKKIRLRVLHISLPDGLISARLPLIYSNASCRGGGLGESVSFEGGPFVFSQRWNVFISVGCNTLATVNTTDSAVVGCRSKCAGTSTNISQYHGACSGRDRCCQTMLPFNLQGFSVDFKEEGEYQGCNYAFLAGIGFLRSDSTGLYDFRLDDTVPVVLEWGIASNTNFALDLTRQAYKEKDRSNYYDSFTCDRYSLYANVDEIPIMQCFCGSGYHGNPYLIEGCKDINECGDSNLTRCPDSCVNQPGSYECVSDGRRTDVKERATSFLIYIGAGLGALGNLLLFSWWLYRVIKKRREAKLKEKYFKRNGGLLLQQQLSSPEGNVEKSKLFNSKDLEKATDHFNKDRILGQGGQGTVYKGMLTDGKIVAIKKSEVVDEGKVEQFINEVLILSQINHRNIVKLLGCCLETEVPLLVYEFIPNGTLYQCLHDPNEEFQVPWDTRLRVATEIAGALSYLHSAASIPIYHRDIKSTNILLDEKYQAKVADFGTSKSVSLDQTHVTTLVRGTFGYLDPEYFQTSQFTDRSDVYSFAVVLVELLTGRKPISPLSEEEGRNLVAYFIISMEEDSVFDMVDAQVLKEGKEEEITAVANLARRCLNSIGRNRPMMKEVAMELERIRRLRNPLDFQQNRSPSDFQQDQETVEATESHDASFTSSKSYYVDLDVTAFSDVQPFAHCETW
ncbi:wall-associated receptor kinase-like 1 [Syzygium oleosum]|uniref:wall-associated receptor kinase-like 1 n=1 Tax=Syzygium oleosum TaxID=219896 RepID=UPI0024B99CE6|nr:wall-associated receptor kinase-like 1 [Syzygium oleosum]